MAELARIERGGLVSNFDEAARAAKAMAQSEYFSDASSVAQAMVKVMAGNEMGFGPFASMSGIHVIKGKPSIGANLMAAAVKSHPRYDYRVRKMSADAVALEFFQDGESLGLSEFTAADAKRAGTQNLSKFPRNMLFARAMSNGVKWFTPDVFNGSAVYTPDELGAEVDDDRQYVEAEVREVPQVVEEAQPEQAAVEPEPTVTPEPEQHWIKDEASRKSFWMWAKGKGLSGDDVHAALGVEHVEEFAGSKADAAAAITDWTQREF